MTAPADLDTRLALGLADYAAAQVPDGSVPTSLALPPAPAVAAGPLAKWLAPAAAAVAVIAVAIIVLMIGNHRRPQAPIAVPLSTPSPTATPSPQPTDAPTPDPTATAEPTAAPTPAPTVVRTPAPTAVPTARPTKAPTPKPTAAPTAVPTPAKPVPVTVSLTSPNQSVSMHVGQYLQVTFGSGQWTAWTFGLAGGAQTGTSAVFEATKAGRATVNAWPTGAPGQLPRSLTVTVVN